MSCFIYCYAGCHCVECRVLFTVMLNAFMQSVVFVIMLNVVMLGVVAPGKHYDVFKLKRFVYLQTLNEKNKLAFLFVLLSDATMTS